MNPSRDVFNRKHRKNIRQKVERGTGTTLNRHAPRSATARVGIVFAVFAACVLFGTSALAMSVSEVNTLLYYVLPEAAQFFKPVQKSSVDQGIEVRVESAYIHGAEAEAVVVMAAEAEATGVVYSTLLQRKLSMTVRILLNS